MTRKEEEKEAEDKVDEEEDKDEKDENKNAYCHDGIRQRRYPFCRSNGI